MSSTSISSKVISSFLAWVVRASDADINYVHAADGQLSDFIYGWVESGEGVVACNGDFQTYLIAVIALTEAWQTGPINLGKTTSESGKVERSVSKVFDRNPDLDDDYDGILDPYWFAACTFRVTHR